MVKLNVKLNLVMQVETARGTAHVHSMPISREVFEANYLPISKAFSSIYSQGLHAAAGPRVSKMLLLTAARELGVEDEVQAGLMNEIRRLTNVVVMTDSNGWETMPLDEALKNQLIEPDDISEIENAIVFFIVASAMHKKKDVGAILAGAGRMWDLETTSSNCTEYAKSLPTLTEAESTGEKETPLLIPS